MITPENPNFYSVKAQNVKDIYLPQTGRSHRFIFQNWTTTNATITSPANLEAGFYNSPVVFTAGNSEVMANYKGTQLSNTQSAFSNSGQRKFIMTPQAGHQYGGDLHLVYESMGKIWYERSTDGGATWALGNEGKPINNDYVYDKGTGQTTGTGNYTTAKHPSLDYCGSKVFVVFQEQLGSNYLIRLAALENGAKMNPANDIPFTSSGQYSEDVCPEIAIKDEGQAVVAIRRNDASLKGLEVHYLLLYPATGMSKQRASGWITGTNENTGSFTLATARNSTDKYHIAWQQNLTSSSSIQYTKFNFIFYPGETYSMNTASSMNEQPLLLPPPEGEWRMNIIETVNVSSPTGYTRSYFPSMIGASDGTARIAFKGFRLYYGGSGTYSVSLCNPDNLSWIPYLRKYYGEVFSPQINQGSETYFVGWTELSNGSYRTIATDASTLRNMETVEGSLGRDIQINNGGTRVQQFSMGFNSESTTLPYTFRRSNSIGDIQVNKKAPSLSGRGIFLTQGENQMYFILGNITSEGMMINFIESRDSVSLDGSLKKVNQYMTTEPFSMKENSFVTFAVNYGFRDSLSSKRLLKGGDAASFRVEMIDDASGRVIGTYLEVRMDKENVFNFREGIFKISSDGVGNRLVRLRVSVAENMKSHYTISEMLLGGGIPLSKSLKEMEMGLTGSMEVREYSLSQNYPNPFNPATIINYALPRASKVTLKVYDILGKEVATLVKGYLEMGKYSVEFNASNLPSGIYVYEIRANDFVKSGKMMFLK
ncbi:MAG TPA: T9SS type A sorting domain-containing protein [Ignavibacteriales bacterium]|nr:T9SS type A sorting domain-containing protein [Ignavibacteriales bacterium]